MSSPIELQHVNVKLLANDPEDVRPRAADSDFSQLDTGRRFSTNCCWMWPIIGTCTTGPGVMLIGQQANYSVDNTDNRLGVRYNRKAALDGTNQDRLKQAARSALTAFQRLEVRSVLKGEAAIQRPRNGSFDQRPTHWRRIATTTRIARNPNSRPFSASFSAERITRCRMKRSAPPVHGAREVQRRHFQSPNCWPILRS